MKLPKLRALVLSTVWIGNLITATPSFALSVGNLYLKSNLHQPLAAEISLNQMGDNPLQDIQVKIASHTDFKRANLEKEAWFREINFEVGINENQQPVIFLKSQKPVNDPFIDLLIDVSFAGGKLLKEFTVLLDPQPVALKKLPEPKPSAPNFNNLTHVKAKLKSASNAGNVYGPISKKDTLWVISNEIVKNTEFSVYQGIMAIYAANEQLFKTHSIHNLPVGANLALPDLNQIAKTDKKQALDFFLANKEITKKPKKALTIVANDIVATSQKEPTQEIKKTNDSDEIAKKMLMLEELIDTLQRQNETIGMRYEALEQKHLEALATLENFQGTKNAQTATNTNTQSLANIGLKPVSTNNKKAIEIKQTQGSNLELKPTKTSTFDTYNNRTNTAIPDLDLDADNSLVKPSSNLNSTANFGSNNSTIPNSGSNWFLYIFGILGLSALGALWYKFNQGLKFNRKIFDSLQDLEKFQGLQNLQNLREKIPDLSKLKDLKLPTREAKHPMEHPKYNFDKVEYGIGFEMEQALDAIKKADPKARAYRTNYQAANINFDPNEGENSKLEDAKVYIKHARYSQAEKILIELVQEDLQNPNIEALVKLLDIYLKQEKNLDFAKYFVYLPSVEKLTELNISEQLQASIRKLHNIAEQKFSE